MYWNQSSKGTQGKEFYRGEAVVWYWKERSQSLLLCKCKSCFWILPRVQHPIFSPKLGRPEANAGPELTIIFFNTVSVANWLPEYYLEIFIYWGKKKIDCTSQYLELALPGIEPVQWKCRVITTGMPRKSCHRFRTTCNSQFHIYYDLILKYKRKCFRNKIILTEIATYCRFSSNLTDCIFL